MSVLLCAGLALRLAAACQEAPASAPAVAAPEPDRQALPAPADLPTTTSLEREVAELNRRLSALVSSGAAGVEALRKGSAAELELEQLGVSGARAEQIRSRQDDVRALQAKVQLMELRAPSTNNPNEGFRPVAEIEAAPAVAAPPPATQPAASDPAAEVPAAEPVAADAVSVARLSLDPAREAEIAFLQGDLDGVLVALALEPVERLSPEALFCYGSALVAKRRFADARPPLDRLRNCANRPTLAAAARRQLERMERMESGVVSLPPDLGKEQRR